MVKKKRTKNPIRLNRIKIVLAEKDINQTELADLINRDRNSISRMANNITQPSLKLLFEIASALHVDVRSLITPIEEIQDHLQKNKDNF